MPMLVKHGRLGTKVLAATASAADIGVIQLPNAEFAAQRSIKHGNLTAPSKGFKPSLSHEARPISRRELIANGSGNSFPSSRTILHDPAGWARAGLP